MRFVEEYEDEVYGKIQLWEMEDIPEYEKAWEYKEQFEQRKAAGA